MAEIIKFDRENREKQRARQESISAVTAAFDTLRLARQDHMACFGDDPLAAVATEFDVTPLLAAAAAYNAAEDRAAVRPVRDWPNIEYFTSGGGDYQRYEITMRREDFNSRAVNGLRDLVRQSLSRVALEGDGGDDDGGESVPSGTAA